MYKCRLSRVPFYRTVLRAWTPFFDYAAVSSSELDAVSYATIIPKQGGLHTIRLCQDVVHGLVDWIT